jgi:hypothetical protein
MRKCFSRQPIQIEYPGALFQSEVFQMGLHLYILQPAMGVWPIFEITSRYLFIPWKAPDFFFFFDGTRI